MSDFKHAFVTKDFRDAGTEKAFVGGKVVELTHGEFINFAAADLVREPTDEEVKASKADATADSKADAAADSKAAGAADAGKSGKAA